MVGLWLKKNGKYGFINDDGKEVVPPIYDRINKFGEYVKDWAKVELNGQKGFISSDGNIIVPLKYSEIEKFDVVRKNWALVKDKNEKMGFIDKTGKEIIPVQYDSIEAFTKKKGLINDVSKKTEIFDVD